MYNISDVTAEIEKVIESLDRENVRALSPRMITEEIFSQHSDISGKARQYERMAAGNLSHADEIRRYIEQRQEVA